MTEILTDDNGHETTEIKAEFPWGQETIETIRNISTKMFENLDLADHETFLVCMLCSYLYLVCSYYLSNIKINMPNVPATKQLNIGLIY